jgi:hypothetical protein
MAVAKYKAVVIAVLLACSVSRATTVVVLASPHGIVITTDSHLTRTSSDRLNLGKGITKKFFIVQDHIVVATIGHSDIRGDSPDSAHYDFLAWMEQLSASLPSDISAEQLANVIYAESSKLFKSVDPALKAGVIHRENSEDFCEGFIQYVVVGYSGGKPLVYVVESYIDWDDQRLITRPPFLRKLEGTSFYFLGFSQALTDIANANSYAYQQTMQRAPKAFRDLVAERDLPLNEAVSIASATICVEEKTNPSSVGGDVQGVTILPNGRASEITPTLCASGKRAH